MKKVYVGGVSNESEWKNRIVRLIEKNNMIPIVKDYSCGDLLYSLEERELCDYCIYIITPLTPKIPTLSELMDASSKRPSTTMLCVLEEDGEYEFNNKMKISLEVIKEIVEFNGVKILDNSLWDI